MRQNNDTLSPSCSRRDFSRLVVCLPLLSLAACAVPGSSAPPRRVRLRSATDFTDFPADPPTVGWSLQVKEPTATLSLNTAKIAIGSSEDVKYLSGGEWASRAPEMVMELIVESFKNSKTIETVGDRRARIRADYELELQLTRFHVLEGENESGTVRVSLDATMVNRSRRSIVASKSFLSDTNLESLALDGIVAAFNKSLQDVMQDLVAWSLQSVPNV